MVTLDSAAERRSLSRWVAATLVIFAMLGVCFGTWLSRLPSVRDHLGASTLEMSVYGLSLAVGSLTGLAFSGRTVSRLGPRRTVAIGAVMQAAALSTAVALLWAGQVGFGMIALAAYGFSFATAEVAISVIGADAERAVGRPRMPLFHAAYSLGSMSAMGAGAVGEAVGLPVPIHFALTLALIVAAALIALRWVPIGAGQHTGDDATSDEVLPRPAPTGPLAVVPRVERRVPARPYSPWRDRRIYLIGTLALCMGLVEGSGADWIALALVDGRGFDNSSGTLMVALFFGSMLLVRIAGSPILARFGRVAAIRACALLAALGIVIVILVPSPWAAVVGVMLWGGGCALGFPVGISAAADDPANAIKSVAAVSAIAYGAYLIGPVMIGLLGERYDLLTSFWTLVVAMLLCLAVAGAARESGRASEAGSVRSR